MGARSPAMRAVRKRSVTAARRGSACVYFVVVRAPRALRPGTLRGSGRGWRAEDQVTRAIDVALARAAVRKHLRPAAGILRAQANRFASRQGANPRELFSRARADVQLAVHVKGFGGCRRG